MLRRTYIEQIRRLIYNGQPSDDATITIGLVNVWLEQGIAYAAGKNYTDTFQMDGVAYVNNSFYSTFKNLPVTKDEQFLYKVALPQIPVGVGANEGIETLIFTDSVQNSYPVVWLTENQKSISRGMRAIPNKLIGYYEGQYAYVYSVVPLTTMTSKVTMISGGDATNLDSVLNVPSNYIPVITEFLVKNLLLEKSQPLDSANDGRDALRDA